MAFRLDAIRYAEVAAPRAAAAELHAAGLVRLVMASEPGEAPRLTPLAASHLLTLLRGAALRANPNPDPYPYPKPSPNLTLTLMPTL